MTPFRIVVPVLALMILLALEVSAPSAASPPLSEIAGQEEVVSAPNGQHEADVAVYEFHQQVALYLASLTPPTTAPAQRVAPAPAPNYDPGDGSRWDQLAICESGGNWSYPPVSGGFSGGVMFHIGTWKANGGEEFAPDAYLATREQQIIVAERVLAASGWGAWPGCSRKYGWR